MEKRLLLSLALSFLVLLVFYMYSPRPIAEPPPPMESGETVEANTTPEIAEVPSPTSQTPAQAIGAPPGEAEPMRSVEAEQVQTAEVQTPRYAARVRNQGGVLESVRLSQYLDAGGSVVELLGPEEGERDRWPVEIVTGDALTDEALRAGLYVTERVGDSVRLEFAADGLRVFKEFTFDPEAYRIGFVAEVSRNGRPVPFSLVWQGGFGDQSREYDPTLVNLLYREGDSFERLNVTDLEPQELPQTTHVGIEDQYFVAMFLLPEPVVSRTQRVEPEAATEEDMESLVRLIVPYPDSPIEFYIGPKQPDELMRTDPALGAVVDYGFFAVLARPLLIGLNWIDRYVGNYGWSIVLLTLLINVALFPLRLKQQLSMLKMQKIQPHMRTLQDKYKKLKADDPKRPEVQAEMMGLYKKHGVNPLGGCLPMLLQMPIFFAMFQLLRSSIELRQAPWILWIRDLSVYDPYYVLPVLMGAAMMATQKLTPTATDPMQARIMMFMPLMFMFFMIFFQSGLQLYWLTSNVVGAGQQYLINKHWAPKPKKPQAPPEQPQEVPVVEDSAGTQEESAEPKRRKRRRKKK